MKDSLQQFFLENNVDFKEPELGHFNRFEKKLSQTKSMSFSWKWLSAAASILLVMGFWLGSNHQKKQIDLADVSPKMEEVQNYFVSTIHQELKTLEKNRNLETEFIIEQTLDELENLEDDYKLFVKELNTSANKKKIINLMIKNYQKRLELLENVLKQIEQLKNTKNEIYV